MNAFLHLDAESAPITMLWDYPLTDRQFEELCLANDVFRLERTKDGEVIVQAPAGGFMSDGNSELVFQLRNWWKASPSTSPRFGAVTNSELGDLCRPRRG